MLDPAIRMQLAAYLKRLKHPIELIATLDTSEKSQEMRGLLDDIAALSDKVSVRHNGQDARTPSFAIARPSKTSPTGFAAAWAELARDKANAQGAFVSAIPKPNLAKVAGLPL